MEVQKPSACKAELRNNHVHTAHQNDNGMYVHRSDGRLNNVVDLVPRVVAAEVESADPLHGPCSGAEHDDAVSVPFHLGDAERNRAADHSFGEHAGPSHIVVASVIRAEVYRRHVDGAYGEELTEGYCHLIFLLQDDDSRHLGLSAEVQLLYCSYFPVQYPSCSDCAAQGAFIGNLLLFGGYPPHSAFFPRSAAGAFSARCRTFILGLSLNLRRFPVHITLRDGLNDICLGIVFCRDPGFFQFAFHGSSDFFIRFYCPFFCVCQGLLLWLSHCFVEFFIHYGGCLGLFNYICFSSWHTVTPFRFLILASKRLDISENSWGFNCSARQKLGRAFLVLTGQFAEFRFLPLRFRVIRTVPAAAAAVTHAAARQIQSRRFWLSPVLLSLDPPRPFTSVRVPVIL